MNDDLSTENSVPDQRVDEGGIDFQIIKRSINNAVDLKTYYQALLIHRKLERGWFFQFEFVWRVVIGGAAAGASILVLYMTFIGTTLNSASTTLNSANTTLNSANTARESLKTANDLLKKDKEQVEKELKTADEERKKAIDKKNEAIEERKNVLVERDEAIDEKNKAIEEHKNAIAERDKAIDEKNKAREAYEKIQSELENANKKVEQIRFLGTTWRTGVAYNKPEDMTTNYGESFISHLIHHKNCASDDNARPWSLRFTLGANGQFEFIATSRVRRYFNTCSGKGLWAQNNDILELMFCMPKEALNKNSNVCRKSPLVTFKGKIPPTTIPDEIMFDNENAEGRIPFKQLKDIFW